MDEKYKPLLSALQSTIRAASGVSSQDISFYRRLDKQLDKSSKKQSDRLLELANAIMGVAAKGEVEELVADENNDDLKENWDDVSLALDSLTQNIDLALLAHKKQLKKATDSVNNTDTLEANNMTKLSDPKSNEPVVSHHHEIAKPQLKFKIPVNNSKDNPFRPLLTEKPNAIVPFEESVKLIHPTEPDENGSLMRPYFPQPYEREILESEYPSSVYRHQPPIPSLPWNSTKPIWVDTPEKLEKMIESISDAKELAIDLEHHNYRSYLGITCLLQLSDRKNDYIIDAIALRTDLQPLNKIFTNPNIIKVLHGANMDIIWLQRDLGLYIVSLFDTFYASKALNLKRNGLAYLLETYANFQTSKKYQLADWRIRPIPEEMLSYAQSDTHFLLNIYDKMKNQLVSDNRITEVLEQSRDVARRRFEIPGYDDEHYPRNNPFEKENSASQLALKNNLDRKQLVYLEHLMNWRDETARKLDESQSYLMPVHTLIALSTSMPTKSADIIKISGSHAHRLREHAKQLSLVMLEAKKIADSFQKDDSEALNEIDTSKSISIDYENSDDYEIYRENYEHLLEQQKKIFAPQHIEQIVRKFQNPISKLWGSTYESTASDESLIEHFPKGIFLYSAIVEPPQDETKTEDFKFEKTEDEPQENDDNVIFIGQSNKSQVLADESKDTKGEDFDSSQGNIELPSSAELIASQFNLLSKSQRKKLKRKMRKEAEAKEELATDSTNIETSETSEQKRKREEESTDQLIEEDSSHSSASKKPKLESLPFNYDKAPSVLNRNNEEDGKKKKKKNKKKNKAFNPYGIIESEVKAPQKKEIHSAGVTKGSSISFKHEKN